METEAHGEVQEIKQPNKFKRFIKESIRVLRVTKKPNKTEYLTIVKVTGLGIVIIGAIGFIIFLLWQYIKLTI